MARTKKVVETNEQEFIDAPAESQELTPVLTFAEVMKIHRELKASGSLPADISLPPRKRAKTKAF